MTKRLRIIRRDGSKTWGTATDEHASSSYGLVVVVVDGEAYGAGDMQLAGYRIICGDAKTRTLLEAAGYTVESTATDKEHASGRIDADILRRVDEVAKKMKKPRSATIEMLLEEALDARDEKGSK